jgi:hypothetical protein
MSHYLTIVFGPRTVEDQMKIYNEQGEYLKKGLLITQLRMMGPHRDSFRMLRNKVRDIVVGEKESIALIHGETKDWAISDMIEAGIDHFVTMDDNGRIMALARGWNERGKWDWYEVGGRWDGWLKMLPGCYLDPSLGEQAAGKGGLHGPLDASGYSALTKAKIDIIGMLEKYRKEQMDQWHIVQACIAQRDFKSWQECRDEAKGEGEETGKTVQAAREFYNNQQVIIDLRKLDIGFWAEEYLQHKTLADAFKYYTATAITPFAFLLDGRWNERGEMGWFGMSSNEMDPVKWYEIFQEAWNSVPEDTLISVVDCHT